MYVEGRLRTRKWQDKEGKDRYTTEIVADAMQLLGSRSGMGGGDTSSALPRSVLGGNALPRQLKVLERASMILRTIYRSNSQC